MHQYEPRRHEVISDISVEDFNESGSFARLREALIAGSFADLVEDERQRVLPFLREWQSQLLAHNAKMPLVSTVGLEEAFLKTPALSGVVYFSHNIVVSESLFDPFQDNIRFANSREAKQSIKEQLAWVRELTFSVPRVYEFFGYTNSWGFIRFPRFDDTGNDAGVLVSCTTVDERVLALLKKFDFLHIVEMYNRVWDDSIHDYLHNIALYTSPSFGIGKVSPMSALNLSSGIEAWGKEMLHQKNNYEYWAHRTHRRITESVLSRSRKLEKQEAACNYVREILKLCDVLAEHGSDSVADHTNVIAYLLSIYVWPLNIVFDPQSSDVAKFLRLLELIPFKFIDDPVLEVSRVLMLGRVSESDERLSAFRERFPSGLDGILHFVQNAKLPVELSITGYLKALGVHRWKSELPVMTWAQRLTLTIAVVGYRGFYEGWRHAQPVIYANKPAGVYDVVEPLFTALEQSLSAISAAPPVNIRLRGIVP